MKKAYVIVHTNRYNGEGYVMSVEEPVMVLLDKDKADAIAEAFDGKVEELPFDDAKPYMTPIVRGKDAE